MIKGLDNENFWFYKMKLQWVKRSDHLYSASIILNPVFRIFAEIENIGDSYGEQWCSEVQVVKTVKTVDGNDEDLVILSIIDDDENWMDDLDEAKIEVQDIVDCLNQHMDEELGKIDAIRSAIAEAKTLFLEATKNANRS